MLDTLKRILYILARVIEHAASTEIDPLNTSAAELRDNTHEVSQ